MPQSELTSITKFLSICYMFIGGSPASTAGGIKTVTLGVIILLVINYIRGNQDINIFNKKIPTGAINRAIIVFVIIIRIVPMIIGGAIGIVLGLLRVFFENLDLIIPAVLLYLPLKILQFTNYLQYLLQEFIY